MIVLTGFENSGAKPEDGLEGAPEHVLESAPENVLEDVPMDAPEDVLVDVSVLEDEEAIEDETACAVNVVDDSESGSANGLLDVHGDWEALETAVELVLLLPDLDLVLLAVHLEALKVQDSGQDQCSVLLGLVLHSPHGLQNKKINIRKKANYFLNKKNIIRIKTGILYTR